MEPDFNEEFEDFELTQEQKDELDRRSQWFEDNPGKGIPWDEIKAKYLKEDKT